MPAMPTALRSTLALLASVLAVAAARPAFAQDFPGTTPVTIVMTFPAGSGVDIVGRLLQDSMQKSLGINLVYEYRPGAAGNVASEYVARAKPDGHTILFGTAATHGVNAALYKKLPFDVEADFTPISPIVNVSNVLTINPTVVDVKSVKELIDLLRANPGKYNYASTGNGTGTHLAMAEFLAKTGLTVTHIPYKGGPDAVASVVKGDVCCYMSQVQAMIPHYKAGKVRLLGVTTKERVSAIPEIPTIAESGVPGFENYTWFGLFGPKNMNPVAVTRINQAVKAALETPAIRQRLIDTGNSPRYETPEQFRATVKADRAKWAVVVRESGATID
ncbi:MAG: tripartite tricarboxylate transporter substrate binding protein [Burkholderiales bacterium]|nr:tripartite tricarboxylate transporter substrate binding protein [Burkholderiales bacterium]